MMEMLIGLGAMVVLVVVLAWLSARILYGKEDQGFPKTRKRR
jgi:flagellar biogenesis protein FliO